MPLASVQQHLKSVLNGAELAVAGQVLEARITPPDPGDGMVPTAYIWGSTATEARQSMPRASPGEYSTGGFKKIVHQVDIWVVWYGYSSDPMADSAFPSVIDAVTAVLRNTLMPFRNLVDPLTGASSTLLAIGEKLNWDYAPVHSTADQRILRYVAKIGCTVEELLQA